MLSKLERFIHFARKLKARGSNLVFVGWGTAAVLWIFLDSLIRSSDVFGIFFFFLVSLGYLGAVLWLLPVIVLTCLKLARTITTRGSTRRTVSDPSPIPISTATQPVPISTAAQPVPIGAADQREALRPLIEAPSSRRNQRRFTASRKRRFSFSASDVLSWWQRQWGSLSPGLQRRFLARTEIQELLRFPQALVIEAISNQQKLVDILRYVQDRYGGPRDNWREFGSGPFGSDPFGGGAGVPRRPRHPSGRPGLEKDLPRTPDDYRFQRSRPRWIEISEEERSPSHGWKKTG